MDSNQKDQVADDDLVNFLVANALDISSSKQDAKGKKSNFERAFKLSEKNGEIQGEFFLRMMKKKKFVEAIQLIPKNTETLNIAIGNYDHNEWKSFEEVNQFFRDLQYLNELKTLTVDLSEICYYIPDCNMTENLLKIHEIFKHSESYRVMGHNKKHYIDVYGTGVCRSNDSDTAMSIIDHVINNSKFSNFKIENFNLKCRRREYSFNFSPVVDMEDKKRGATMMFRKANGQQKTIGLDLNINPPKPQKD